MPRAWQTGYVSCGFGRTPDLLEVIDRVGEIGFEAFEIELWKGHLHPQVHDAAFVGKVAERLRAHRLRPIIATGEEYVMSERSGEPSFVSDAPEDRARRRDFTIAILELAQRLGAECVQVVSGPAPPGATPEALRQRLCESLGPVLEAADRKNINIALENDPGHFVRTVDEFRRVKALLPSRRLRINLDIGHARVAEEAPLGDVVRLVARDLENVHLEDTRGRTHLHLPLGQGDIDFVPVFQALAEVGYGRSVNVELYGFADDEVEVARTAHDYLLRAADRTA